jgi:hypothetical protein
MTSQRSARVAGGIIGSQGAGSSRKAGSQSPTGVGEPHELSERMSTGALLRPISRWVGRVSAIEITSPLLLSSFDRPSLK